MFTVTAVHADGALRVRPDGATRDLALPADYLQQDQVTHAYAITGHKAQGVTVDHAFVVADETIDGEWGYVAMSRGRHTNHLYLADTDLADQRRHTPQPTDDPTGGSRDGWPCRTPTPRLPTARCMTRPRPHSGGSAWRCGSPTPARRTTMAGG